MRECIRLQKASGMTVADFAKACGFSRDYWFVRARFDAPLTVSDCERIAKTCGMTLRQLFANALAEQEEKRTAETLNKLQRGDVALAAYRAAGKQEAINGEAGPDYDEPA